MTARLLAPAGFTLLATAAFLLAEPGSGPSRGPVRVTIKDDRQVTAEVLQPVDPTPRIVCQFANAAHFGLTVEGKRICCSPNGSIWSTFRINGGAILQPGFVNGVGLNPNQQPQPLANGPGGKKRTGFRSTWSGNNIHVTQTIEIVPSKSTDKKGDGKRKLDTAFITFQIENKDTQPHKVEFRTCIDMLIGNNDGALYASPATQPGKLLNGVVLEGKELPPYLWCMENNDPNNPGFHATMTLKGGRGVWPSKVVLSHLGAVGQGFNQWEIAAQPAGDSACALYWKSQELKPGEKRDLVWGYGGGLASDPESEGKVSLGLAGSFEPGKRFTLLATVDDPAPNQVLSLELPPGMECLEGPAIQPVAPPSSQGSSIVLWKARVQRVGDYAIKVHSSTGTTQIKHITIEPASAN